jgi:WD40 repeat protein
MTHSINVAQDSGQGTEPLKNTKETDSIIESSQVAEVEKLSDTPYKGLNPYNETDNSIFFGRTDDIQDVVNELLAWPLTILYGRSGVGKSSLLRAGVTHILNEEARQNIADFGVPKLAVVVFPPLEGEYDLKLISLDSIDDFATKGKSLVVVAKIHDFYHVRIFDGRGNKIIDKGKDEFLPDAELCQNMNLALCAKFICLETKNKLIQQIASSLGHTLKVDFTWQDDNLLSGLMQQIEVTISRNGWNIEPPQSSASLIDNLKAWAGALGGDEGDGKLYIILDQFEEYFLYHSLEHGKESFATELIDTINSSLPINFLISLRDDSYSKLNRFKRYISDWSDHVVEIKHLDLESAYEAIEEPVKIYNNDHQSVEIKPDFIKAVLKGIKQFRPSESGLAGIEKQESEIEAPYLQLVMTRLWQEMNSNSRCLNIETLMRLADLRFKGIDQRIQSAINKIFRQHLETSLKSLSSTEKDIVANIFQYLVTPSGSKYAYSISDLYTYYTNYESEYEEDELEYGGKLELECQKFKFTLLLEKLAKGEHRILSPLPPLPNQPAEEKRFQIFHDILGQPILDWRKRYMAKKDKVQFEIKGMELASLEALRQFMVDGLQLKALLNAMRAGNKLEKLLRRQVALEDAAKARVILVLQKILDSIREQNQIQHPDTDSPIYAICLSPDNQQLATGSADGVITLWDLHGHYIHSFGSYPNLITSLSFHPKDAQLAVAYLDGHIQCWALQGKLLREFHCSVLLHCIQFSPDGQFLAVGLANGTTQLLNLHGQQIAQYDRHQGPVSRIQFSPDGRNLLTASMDLRDFSAYLWTIQGERMTEFSVPEKMIYDISFSPDGQSVATALRDMTVRLWDIQGQQQAELKGHEGPIWQVDFSPDGQQIRTVAWDGTARWWDREGYQIRKLKICQRPLMQASFSSDGCHLAILSMVGIVHLWDIATQENAAIKELNKQGGMNFCVDFHPDGQLLVTASVDGTDLWTLQGKHLRTFEGQSVYCAQFSPDGHMLATASIDGTARLLNLEGQLLVELEGPAAGPLMHVTFSPNGKLLATASYDRTARIWNCKGELVAELNRHQGYVFSVSFSPDERHVATASGDAVVRLWTLQGNLCSELRGHAHVVSYVCFSPDGQYLATASWDGTARIWDLNGNEVAKFSGHSGAVFWASFRPPDGCQLATASGDHTVRLWDMKGNQLGEFRDHQDMVLCVQFSPDGKYLATASADGTSKLRPVEDLNNLLDRGKDWLKDYLETHPDWSLD